jgi:hypothetical protein
MGLYHLFYYSQAQQPFDAVALRALLHQSRAYNRAHHVSGLLLHTPDGRFFQILEGEEAVVRALYYNHIVADPRHRRCRLLGAGACAERSFADWNMGARIATAAELHALLTAAPVAAHVLFAPVARVRPELLALLLAFVANHELETTGYL